MRIYLIFLIITPMVEERYPFFIDKRSIQYDGKHKVCLYGFTESKKLIKKFKECRESYMFHIQKMDVENDSFKQWYITNWIYELHDVYFDKEKISMCITELEKNAVINFTKNHWKDYYKKKDNTKKEKSKLFQHLDVSLGKVVKLSMDKLDKMSNFEKWLALYSPTINIIQLSYKLQKDAELPKKYMDIL